MSGQSLKPATGGFDFSQPADERYRIVGRIAAGGMAEIYLARMLGNVGVEREVVLKRLLPELQSDQEFVQMFFDEARIASQMRHANIVQIYELGELDGSLFISMELLRGVNLRDMLARLVHRGERMPAPIAARIACGALEALAYAHQFSDPDGRILNVVHRDVSPQNIIVTYEGGVKLVDFGVAKAEGRLHQTRAGLIKGKFAYMSPEQIGGGTVDGRSDLFALAEVFYELLLNRHPFYAETDLEVLRAILDVDPPAPHTVDPTFPRAFGDILMRALQKHPGDRFQDAEEMHAALEYYLQQQRAPATSLMLGRFVRELFADRLEMERRAREQSDNEMLIEAMTVGRSELEVGRKKARTRAVSVGRRPSVATPRAPSSVRNEVVELSAGSTDLPEGAPKFMAHSGYRDGGARKRYFQTQVQKLFDELGSLEDTSPNMVEAEEQTSGSASSSNPSSNLKRAQLAAPASRGTQPAPARLTSIPSPRRRADDHSPLPAEIPTQPDMFSEAELRELRELHERVALADAPPEPELPSNPAVVLAREPAAAKREPLAAPITEPISSGETHTPEPSASGELRKESQTRKLDRRAQLEHAPAAAPIVDRWGLLLFVAGLGALVGAIVYAFVLYATAETETLRLTVSSRPAGASIFLNGSDTGASTPQVFQNVPSDRELAVELRLEGYAPFTKTVPPSSATHDLVIDEELKPLTGGDGTDLTGLGAAPGK